MTKERNFNLLVFYMRRKLKEVPYSKLRTLLLEKGWPESVVSSAYSHIIKEKKVSTESKTSQDSINNKGSNKDTADEKMLDILTAPIIKKSENYHHDLFLKKEKRKLFYEKIKKKEFEEPKSVPQEPLEKNTPPPTPITAKITPPKKMAGPLSPQKFKYPSEKEFSDEDVQKIIDAEKTASPQYEEKEDDRPIIEPKITYNNSSQPRRDPFVKPDVNIELKLELLEEQLKNFGSNPQVHEFRNKIELEPLEYADEPIGERAQTGIPGLDPIIQGGLRRLNATLVAGGPGSGKSTFGMQFIVNGIEKFKESGIYITFEQTKEELISHYKEFGWDLAKHEREKKLQILRLTPEQMVKILEAGGGTLRDAIDMIHAKRIVIDSISDFLILHKTDLSRRKFLMELFALFTKFGCTSLIISEQETDPLKHITSIVEYQVDGVILLYNERVGDARQRAVEIFKMRGTKHAGRIFPMRIVNSGIVILSKNE